MPAKRRLAILGGRLRRHGLALDPPCAFTVQLDYDSRAPAGSYEPARRAIASYFTLTAPPRRF